MLSGHKTKSIIMAGREAPSLDNLSMQILAPHGLWCLLSEAVIRGGVSRNMASSIVPYLGGALRFYDSRTGGIAALHN